MTRSCSRYRNRIAELVEGDLDGEQSIAVRMHAARCVPCGRELDTAEQIAGELKRAGRSDFIEPPEDLVHRVMARLPWAAGPGAARWRVLLAAALSSLFFSVVAAGLAAGLFLVGRLVARPMLPGVRSGLAAAASWLDRFSALLLGLDALPSVASSTPVAGFGWSALAGLTLLATGILGAIAALSLGAARAPARLRRRG